MKSFTLAPALTAWLDAMDAQLGFVDWALTAQMPQYGYTSLPTIPPLPPRPATDPEQQGVYDNQLVPLYNQAIALVAQLRSYQPAGI